MWNEIMKAADQQDRLAFAAASGPPKSLIALKKEQAAAKNGTAKKPAAASSKPVPLFIWRRDHPAGKNAAAAKPIPLVAVNQYKRQHPGAFKHADVTSTLHPPIPNPNQPLHPAPPAPAHSH